MKKILSLLIAAVMSISMLAAYADDSISIGTIMDPVNRMLIINGSSPYDPEYDVSLKINDENGQTVYFLGQTTIKNGEFSFIVDTKDFEGWNSEQKTYSAYVMCGDKSETFTFAVPFVTSVVPIEAEVTNGVILSTENGGIDSDFSYATIKLKNANVPQSVIDKSYYEIDGIPLGIQAELYGLSNDTIQVTFSGETGQVISGDISLDVYLKSGIIRGNSGANTDSLAIEGIVIYNTEKSTKVWFNQNAGFSLGMKNKTQSKNDKFELEVFARNPTKDGILEYGTDYTFSTDKIPQGLKLNLTANKDSKKIAVSLTGTATSDVVSNISIDDLVIKSLCVDGAIANSNPVWFTVVADSDNTSVPEGSNNVSNKDNGSNKDNSSLGSITGGMAGTDIIHEIPGNNDLYFDDINNHWAKNYIQKLAQNKMINGYGDRTFKPDNAISRAEFLTMVIKVFGFKTNDEYSGAFGDVVQTDWYAKNVESGLVNGLISKDTNFRPNDNITRVEMIKILVCAYLKDHQKTEQVVSVASFTDGTDIPQWAVNFVNQALALGVINGYEDGSFRPQRNLTRGEASSVLSKMIDLI